MPKRESPAASRVFERLAAARAGDDLALEDVIGYYQERIAGYVISRLGRNTPDLDDLCQVVFVKMAMALPRLRSLEVFEPWLFQIARNVCRDYIRQLKSRDATVSLSEEQEGIAQTSGHNSFDAIEALDKLPEAQRELIRLLCEQDYSYEQLAALTRSTVRAVAGRLFRARARLRKLLNVRDTGR
jgi:RNA polymerase sigma-70 factor, ECF subfamily